MDINNILYKTLDNLEHRILERGDKLGPMEVRDMFQAAGEHLGAEVLKEINQDNQLNLF